MMAVMAVAALTANAQVYLGGDLNLATRSGYTNYTIMPEIGYNFSDKWAAGLGIGYTGLTQEDPILQENVTTGTFKLAPYARYTFAKTGMASFFCDGGVEFQFPKGGDTAVEFGLKPGVSLAVSEKFSLVAKLGVLTYNTDSEIFSIGVKNTEISFGALYNF